MPARRKASSGKDSSGRRKRIAGDAGSEGGSRATAADIRAKTPTPKSKQPKRDSLTERRKRKSGVADSAITEPKPKSNRTTPKKTTAHNKGDTSASSGQKRAVRKRSAAPAPTRARRQNTSGHQARTKKGSARRS